MLSTRVLLTRAFYTSFAVTICFGVLVHRVYTVCKNLG
jgi:hypothetical protein